MTNPVDQLAMKIGPFTRFGIPGSRVAINHFERIEPRFSSRALRLFSEMKEHYAPSRDRIIRGLSDGRANKTIVRRLLHEAVLYYSGRMMESIVMDEMRDYPSIDRYVNIDLRIEADHPELIVDVFNDDLEYLTRYYHPFIVAMILLGDRGSNETSEAVAGFIAWAGQQDNFDDALALAWKMNTVDVMGLQQVIDLRSMTHGSLNAGVI